MAGWKTKNEKNLTQIAWDHRAWALEQPATGSCVLCPKWRVAGTAREVAEFSKAHRELHHPDLKNSRRRRKTMGHLLVFRQHMSEAEVDEVEVERQRRMKLLGIK